MHSFSSKISKKFLGRGIVNLLPKIAFDTRPVPGPRTFKMWIRLWVCPPGLPSLKSGCPVGTVGWLRAWSPQNKLSVTCQVGSENLRSRSLTRVSIGCRFTVQQDCNSHCACSTKRKSYDPVCGSDNLTYFSACFAGCTDFVNDVSIILLKSMSCIAVTMYRVAQNK